MKIEIDINNYLSEEEKKEIAIDAFRKSIFEGIAERKESDSRTNYDNYERVISNSIHHYLENEIDNMLECDTKQMIKDNVLKTIKKKDYSYSLFRVASAWEKEDSPAQKISNAAVESYREEMTKKIHNKLAETIDNIDFDTVYELFTDIFQDFLSARLTNDK